jgi:hypothetical protein
VNRAERRHQEKANRKKGPGGPQQAQPHQQQLPGQARARSERGLIRRVSQQKGRGS